jgi:hypothetical protein
MPGPISDAHKGTPDYGPYVPSWCYDAPGPRTCVCGHHEGYHNDQGICLHSHDFSNCGCKAAVYSSNTGESK